MVKKISFFVVIALALFADLKADEKEYEERLDPEYIALGRVVN
jgi:hypothetical protein